MERANEFVLVLLMLLCKTQPADMKGCQHLQVENPTAVETASKEVRKPEARLAGSERRAEQK